MLRFPQSYKTLRKMADNHANKLTSLIRKRLDKPINAVLNSYFTSDQRIWEILTARPAELLRLDRKIYKELLLKHKKNEIDESATRVFNYEDFSKRDPLKYGGDDFCRDFGIRTCLYCNLVNIHPVIDFTTGLVSAKPALDHFFSEGEYPLLALSFFNLVPSCTFCNTNFKRNQNMSLATHLNPHVKSFGDDCVVEFKNFKSLDDILSKKKGKFDLYFNNRSKNPRFDGNITLFHLEDQYNLYKAQAFQALTIAKRYTKAEITSILKVTGLTLKDGYHHLFSTYHPHSELHQATYSKLKRDIVQIHGTSDLKTLLKLK